MPAYLSDDLHTLIWKLSKGSSQIQPGPNYDPDAEAYFAAVLAGSGTVISDPEKENINNFIVGYKALSLWAPTVAGWTLRSTQNAGTANSVYGLKGTYTGTRVNNPTWTADGLNFSNANSKVTAAGASIIQPVTSISIFVQNVSGSNNLLAGFSGSATLSINSNQISVYSGADLFAGTLVTLNQFFMAVGVHNGASSYSYMNGFSNTGNSGTLGFDGGFTMAAYSAGSSETFNGTIAANFLISGDHRSSVTAFYNLYKSTIGQGLGLP